MNEEVDDREVRSMELSTLRDNLMTFASIRLNYADEQIGNEEVKQLLDEVTLSTLKKMKALTSKVGK
jgi:ABC-type lipopolysaccharide export system ATPase subunit